MTHIKFHKEQLKKIKNFELDWLKFGDKSVWVPYSLGLSSHGRETSSGSKLLETRTQSEFSRDENPALPTAFSGLEKSFFILENPEISAGSRSQKPGNPE